MVAFLPNTSTVPEAAPVRIFLFAPIRPSSSPSIYLGRSTNLTPSLHLRFQLSISGSYIRLSRTTRTVLKAVSRIAAIVERNTLREATRSELTRIVDVIRVFFLRASELSGLGDGVFFLTVDELVAVLSGDTSPAAHIPARRQAYEKYRGLPPLPAWGIPRPVVPA